MAVAGVADRLRSVTSEVGDEVRGRRERLGLTIKALAERAGVDRGRLSALEKGDSRPRASTLGAVLHALDELERELGKDNGAGSDDLDVVEFQVAGNFGVRVIVKGPVRDRAELEESVLRLIARMQAGENHDPADN